MENSTNEFVALLKSMNCDNSDVNSKLQCYPKVRQLLDSTFAEGQIIQANDVLRSLYDCILLDLEVDDIDVQYAALQTLDHFLKFKWTDCLVMKISHSLVSFAFSEKYKSRPDIKSAAINCIRASLQQVILHNHCDLETLCPNVENEVKAQVFELIEEVLLDLRTTKLNACLTFYYDVLIHQMYVTNNSGLRSLLVIPVDNLNRNFKFSQLTLGQMESFKGKVSNQYNPQITKLQKANDPNWPSLWIFLLKHMGKVLFEAGYIPIMNALLKNVENSFRGSIDNKLAAFDCWKTLIDNYGNDKQRMVILKQINLVLTPLKRILSREDVYVAKRFETFCHLVNVFQENSSEVYLPFLLSFCFYTFTETLPDDEKVQISFVRKIPSLREKGIQLLVEILGHYGHDSHDCILSKSNCCIKLKKPLISVHNYNRHRIYIKNSIVEYALVMLTCVSNELIPKGTKCIWGSLFSIISQLDAKQQENELKEFATVIMLYGKSNDNTESHQNFFVPILELFSSNQFFDNKLLIDAFLLPLIKECSDVKNQLLARDINVIQDLIIACINEENKANWIKEMCEIFTKVSIDHLNLKFAIQIWMMCNRYLIELVTVSNANVSLTSEELVEQFMLFAVPLLVNSTESKKIVAVSRKWGRSFMKLCMVDKKYEDLVMKLHNLMETMGVFDTAAISFLSGFDCFFTNQNKNINNSLIAHIAKFTVDILSLPNIKQEHMLKCYTFLTSIANFYTDQLNDLEDPDFQILCNCYKLLCTAQKFENLNSIDDLFDKCSMERREILSQTLLKLVGAARSNENKEVAEFAEILTTKMTIKTKKRESFLKPRIILPRGTPSNKSSKIITLFGQAVEAKSPHVTENRPSNGNSVKPTILTKSKTVKRSVVSAIIDENSENFVPINGGYVFEPDKLTEHQIEVMRKPRSDIPALYQDLSQSQSNSQVFFEKLQNAALSTELANGSVNEIPPQNAIENEIPPRNASENEIPPQNAIENEIPPRNASENEIPPRNASENEIPPQNGSENVITKQSESENNITTQSESENEIPKLSENEVLNPSTNDIAQLEQRKAEYKNLVDSPSFDIENKPSLLINDTASESEPKLESNKRRSRSKRLSGSQDDGSKTLASAKKFDFYSSPADETLSTDLKLIKELAKIKMNIVGGEEFTKNLDMSDKIQTRRSRDFGQVPRNFCTRSSGSKTLVKLNSTSKVRTKSPKLAKNNSTKKKTNSITKVKSTIFGNLTQSDDINIEATLSNTLEDDPSKKAETNDLSTTSQLPQFVTNELPKNDDLTTSVFTSPVKTGTKRKRKFSVKSRRNKSRLSITKSVKGDDISEKPDESTEISPKRRKRVTLIRVIDDSTPGNIPREPSQSVADKTKQDLIDSKLSNLSQELSITLVNKPILQSSEDVIESSQDTFVEIVPLKSLLEEATTSLQPHPTAESSIKETTSPNPETNSCSSIFSIPSEDVVSEVPVNEEVIEIKNSESEINMDDVRMDSPDELIRRDLISDVIKSLDTAEMDTETVDINLCSPETAELPTSPLRSDTPSRTKELMDDTNNISPIKTLLQLDCNMEEKIQNAQKLFDREMDAAASSEPEDLQPVNGSSKTILNGNSRGAKLLNSIGYKSPMVVNTWKNTGVKSRISFVPTLKPSRVTKMMQNCGGDTTTNANLERLSEEDPKLFVPEKDVFPEKDILTFIRPLPSPLASPRFGILKRKAPDSRDEDGSPPKKQARRVNFPDPPTTSEKVFFLDNGEENMRRLRSNESLFTELFNENRTDAQRMAMVISESETASIEMDTQVMETQGSVDVTEPTRLDNDVPIFEDLVDCDEKVEQILESVISPIFEKTLLHELNARSIKSVGDLARLSEREVNRLPFRAPRVQTVREALVTFKKSLEKIQTEALEQIFPGPSTSKAALISPLLEPEPDVEEQRILEPTSNSIEVMCQVVHTPKEEIQEGDSNEEVSKEIVYQNILKKIPKEDLTDALCNFLDEINEEEIKRIAFKIFEKVETSEEVKHIAFKLLEKIKTSEITTYITNRSKKRGD